MPRQKTSKTSLKPYQAKRDFKKSPEPSGKGKPKLKAAASKPGEHYFCVQKHLASHLHYDFRLEHRGVLLSWAVPKGPSPNPKVKRLAMRVEGRPPEEEAGKSKAHRLEAKRRENAKKTPDPFSDPQLNRAALSIATNLASALALWSNVRVLWMSYYC
jgi:hypothetical protein